MTTLHSLSPVPSWWGGADTRNREPTDDGGRFYNNFLQGKSWTICHTTSVGSMYRWPVQETIWVVVTRRKPEIQWISLVANKFLHSAYWPWTIFIAFDWLGALWYLKRTHFAKSLGQAFLVRAIINYTYPNEVKMLQEEVCNLDLQMFRRRHSM
jgi:hypothetical protein